MEKKEEEEGEKKELSEDGGLQREEVAAGTRGGKMLMTLMSCRRTSPAFPLFGHTDRLGRLELPKTSAKSEMMRRVVVVVAGLIQSDSPIPLSPSRAAAVVAPAVVVRRGRRCRSSALALWLTVVWRRQGLRLRILVE